MSHEEDNDPRLKNENKHKDTRGERTITNCFEHFAAKTKEQAMRIILRDCKDKDDEEIIMEALQQHKQRAADLEREINRATQENGWDQSDMLERVNDLWNMKNIQEGKMMKDWVNMGRDEIKEKRAHKERQEHERGSKQMLWTGLQRCLSGTRSNTTSLRS